MKHCFVMLLVAVVGMAAFFIGVVQAPVTGIVLVIEMTATFTLLLPMLAAATVAMLLPVLLRSTPIYDALRERAAHHELPDATGSAWNRGRNGLSDREPPLS